MIGILCLSILSSVIMTVGLKLAGNKPSNKIAGSSDTDDEFQDGAARREVHQRGFGKMWWSKSH